MGEYNPCCLETRLRPFSHPRISAGRTTFSLGLQGSQALQFRTDIGHAPGDHHAPGAPCGYARFDSANHPEVKRPPGHGRAVFSEDRSTQAGLGRQCMRNPRCNPMGRAITPGWLAQSCRNRRRWYEPGNQLLQRSKQGRESEKRDSHVKPYIGWRSNTGRIASRIAATGLWRPKDAKRPPPVARVGWSYISMVLRIKPTARPSISKGSPGSTTIV